MSDSTQQAESFWEREQEGLALCRQFFHALAKDDLETARAMLEKWPGWATIFHPVYGTRPYEAAKSAEMLLLLMEFGADKAAISAHLQTLSPVERTRMTMDFFRS